VNDSKKDLGCRVDRHENIGKGCIGIDAFRFLMNDERFKDVPKVIETPKEDDMDPVNLARLRSLVKKPAKAGASRTAP
jgi:deoxyribonuclease-4